MYEWDVDAHLSVSLQRFPRPPSGFVTGVPRSFGALPMHRVADAVSGPRVLFPSPPGEAFWIGLIPRSGWQVPLGRVVVSTGSGGWVNAVTGSEVDQLEEGAEAATLSTPPTFGIPGILRSESTWWVFAGAPPQGTASEGRGPGTGGPERGDPETRGLGTGDPEWRGPDGGGPGTGDPEREGPETGDKERRGPETRGVVLAVGAAARLSAPGSGDASTRPQHDSTGSSAAGPARLPTSDLRTITTVHLEPVDVLEFERISQQRVAPLDHHATYGGQRMP